MVVDENHWFFSQCKKVIIYYYTFYYYIVFSMLTLQCYLYVFGIMHLDLCVWDVIMDLCLMDTLGMAWVKSLRLTDKYSHGSHWSLCFYKSLYGFYEHKVRSSRCPAQDSCLTGWRYQGPGGADRQARSCRRLIKPALALVPAVTSQARWSTQVMPHHIHARLRLCQDRPMCP